MMSSVLLCALALGATPRLLTVNDVFAPRVVGKAAAPAASPRVTPLRATARSRAADVVLELGRDLHVSSDITMNGVRAVETIVFSIPESWKLTAEPRLTLEITPSPALLLDLSSLNIQVNGEGVGVLTYPAADGGPVRVTADLPRSALQEYNRLTLTATQHYTTECEDPFHPSLWTRISRESTISFWRSSVPVVESLDRYPYPLFDPRAHGPVEITLVVPESVTPEIAEAVGRMAVALGRLADYRGVKFLDPVARVEEATTTALLVSRLDGSSSLDASLLLSGLPEGGLVAVRANPANRSLPVLVLGGASDADILLAARAASTNTRLQALAGGMARVDRAVEGDPPASARRSEPASGAPYPLSAIGFKDTTVRGFYAVPISIPLALDGDAHGAPSGGLFKVTYSYPPGLDARLSRIEVAIDGLSLRSVPLDDVAGAERAVAEVRIPGHVVRPDSVIQVTFQLYPKDLDACDRVSDRPLWATLFADSTLDLPVEHYSALPELESLKYGLWPFNAETSNTATEIRLPSDPTSTDLAAAAQLAALIGSRSRAEGWPARIGSGAGGRAAGAAQISLVVSDAPASESGVANVAGTLEAGWSPAGSTLELRAASGWHLLSLARALSEPEALATLSGNVAVLTDDGTLRSFRTAPATPVGEPPSRVASRHWAAWLAVAAAVVVLTSLVARGWAGRRGGETE